MQQRMCAINDSNFFFSRQCFNCNIYSRHKLAPAATKGEMHTPSLKGDRLERQPARLLAACTHALAALSFALCAYVQLNDPDPAIWCTAYLGVALAAAWGCLAHAGLCAVPSASLSVAVTCVSAALPLTLCASTLREAAVAVWRDPLGALSVEAARECAGMALALAWLLASLPGWTAAGAPSSARTVATVALAGGLAGALYAWRGMLAHEGYEASSPWCAGLL